MANSQELAVIQAGDDSPFAVLQMETSELQELIQENIGSDSLSVRDLDRVKVPSGGGTVWEVPSLEGTDATKTIEGVIIHRTTSRGYWPNKYDGSNDPPACASDDGVLGIPNDEHEEYQGMDLPGGPCVECPFNEFGSDAEGIGKACKETRQLFMLTPDSLIPFVITVPPGSLANVKAYTMRLMRSRLRLTDVVTVVSLDKTKSKGGIDYSQVQLRAGARLDPEAASKLRTFASALEPAFRAAARIDRSEVDSDD